LLRQTATSPKPILIVEDEETFAAFLQHFPAARYTLLYASGAAEAMALCETRAPRLMVVPLLEGGSDLISALRAVDHAGAMIVGLAPADAEDTGAPDVDRAVPAGDVDAALNAARELLNERRQHPRVVVEFPVRVGTESTGVAKDISNVSLVIETRERLRVGTRTTVDIHWGEAPRTLSVRVDRVKPLGLGLQSAVLLIDEDDEPARTYLDEIIGRIIEVEHYLWTLEPGRPALRGPVAWDLARRAERSLRMTAEMGLAENHTHAEAETARATNVEPEGESAPPTRAEAPAAHAAQAAEPAGTGSGSDAALQQRYELGKPRGRWGVGDVLEARHRLLDRKVLIKRLRPELQDEPEARGRLEHEARAASRVTNDCVADVLDFGQDGDGLFYAMEWLAGPTLAEALQQRTTFLTADVLRLGVHLSFALAAAHRQQLLHLDLCPEHVLLHEQAEGQRLPKLLAFGGSREVGAPPAHARGLSLRPPGEAGKHPDAGWDVFALARLLSRLRPTDAASEGAARLKAILERASASDESRRFPHMEAFCRALARVKREAEQQEGDDLGTRIVPAVLPDDFVGFRVSSTGIQPVTAPPPAVPWPRTTVALSASPRPEQTDPRAPAAEGPGGAGEPAALEAPPSTSEDPFEDDPTSVADLSGVLARTREASGAAAPDAPSAPGEAPAAQQVAASGRAAAGSAEGVPASSPPPPRAAPPRGRSLDDAPTHVAHNAEASASPGASGAVTEAPDEEGDDAPTRVADPASPAQAPPPAGSSSPPGAPRPPAAGQAAESEPPLKKTLFGVPAAQVPGAPPPQTGGPRAAPPPQTTPAAAEPVDEAFASVSDDEFDEAPTNVVPESVPESDQKTLLGVAAAPKPGTPTAGSSGGAPRAGDAPPAQATPGAAAAPAPAPAPASSADAVSSVIADELSAGPMEHDPATPLAEGEAALDAPEAALDAAPDGAAAPVTGATPVAPEPGGRRPLRVLLLAGLAVLVLAGGGAGLWFGVLAPGKDTPGASSAAENTTERTAGAVSGHDATVTRRRPARGLRPRPADPDAAMAASTNAQVPSDAATLEGDAAATAGDADPDAAVVAAVQDAGGADAELSREERKKFLYEMRQKKKAELKRRLEKRLALINKARHMMRQGRYVGSRKYLTEALEMWDSPRLRQLFSITYSRVGKTWPAIYHQKKAVAQSPSSASRQIRLGGLYLKVGQRGRACMAFRKAGARKYLERHCGGK
jgi:serine/threonine-protein kinase